MNNTYQYISDYINKPTIFCYLLDYVTNTNPYLFDCDGNSQDVNKKVWVAKQVFPRCDPTQYTYFKTFKEAKSALNRWGAKWARA
jgi:hypothetical protein